MATASRSSSNSAMSDYMPGISIDCVVFGYHQQVLSVLLLQFKGLDVWALPGGFLPRNSPMDQAAHGMLRDRTGLEDLFLSQFHTFSALDRGWESNALNRRTFEHILSMLPPGDVPQLRHWFAQRFVSTVYVSLVDSSRVTPRPDDLSERCQWVPIGELPDLVLDHRHMIENALGHIRAQINYLPIGRSLLGDTFTMRELQSLYEAILQKKLDRGNFQRKMLKLNMLIREGKRMTGARNKAPYLYRIDDAVYDRLLRDGIGFN